MLKSKSFSTTFKCQPATAAPDPGPRVSPDALQSSRLPFPMASWPPCWGSHHGPAGAHCAHVAPSALNTHTGDPLHPPGVHGGMFQGDALGGGAGGTSRAKSPLPWPLVTVPPPPAPLQQATQLPRLPTPTPAAPERLAEFREDHFTIILELRVQSKLVSTSPLV